MLRYVFSLATAAAAAFALAALAPCPALAGGDGHARPAKAESSGTDAARKPGPTAARAVAVIEPRSESRMKGRATFTAAEGKIIMELTVEGLAPGLHAVHVHEKGDCSAPDAASAGPHWNPSGADHGKWGEGAFHHGDIGNIDVGKDGKGRITLTTDLWTLGGPEGTNIIGRSVIVHANQDDFKTQPTGNAGGRIGCGVIAAGE